MKSEDSQHTPISLSDLASLLMVTTRRIQQLVQQGHIQKAKHGSYLLEPAVQGYLQFIQGKTQAPEDYHAEKARLVKHQADKAEIEVKTLSGELVRAADVEAEWTDMLSAMKSRLMAIPSKAAPIVAAEDNPAQVIDIIEDLVREALQELSDYANGQRDITEGDESPTATTEANGESVG